jgi:hypothetical protein
VCLYAVFFLTTALSWWQEAFHTLQCTVFFHLHEIYVPKKYHVNEEPIFHKNSHMINNYTGSRLWNKHTMQSCRWLSTFFQNVSNHLQESTVQQPRMPQSRFSFMCSSQISHNSRHLFTTSIYIVYITK